MKVFILSDLHFPYHSKKGYKKALQLLKQEKPDAVVQIGDLLDQYTFSKYSRSLDLINPEKEIKKGLELATQMWRDIQKAVPRAKCYQVLGNHDLRMSKRIEERLPELSSFFDLAAMYRFKGVKTLTSYRDHLELDGVIYCHGWYSKSFAHALHFNKPAVHGHLHRPTIDTSGKLWSMDVGYLADNKSLPLSYTSSKVSKWTLACGVVENRKPRLLFL